MNKGFIAREVGERGGLSGDETGEGREAGGSWWLVKQGRARMKTGICEGGLDEASLEAKLVDRMTGQQAER